MWVPNPPKVGTSIPFSQRNFPSELPIETSHPGESAWRMMYLISEKLRSCFGLWMSSNHEAWPRLGMGWSPKKFRKKNMGEVPFNDGISPWRFLFWSAMCVLEISLNILKSIFRCAWWIVAPWWFKTLKPSKKDRPWSASLGSWALRRPWDLMRETTSFVGLSVTYTQ